MLENRKQQPSDRQVLMITMLGDMRVVWKGEEIVLSKNRAPRYLQLLQMIWLHGERGVTRQDILRDIYEGKSLINPSNTINNLVLQARRHLEDAGLPRADYIVFRGGAFVPDDRIEVHCDAEIFHHLILQASTAGESGQVDEREQLLDEAFETYSGEFLPKAMDLPWVEREALCLAREYREAAEDLIQHALQRGDTMRAAEIRQKADDTEPATGLMQLSETSREEHLCPKRDDGVPVTEAFGTVACGSDLQNAQEKSILPDALLQAEPQGVYRCSSVEGFCDVVRVLQSILGKAGHTASLVRFQLVDYKGRPIRRTDKRAKRMLSLRGCIEQNLRSGDVITQNGDSEYLVLMFGYSVTERSRVLRRIRTSLRSVEGGKAHILCETMPLVETGSH